MTPEDHQEFVRDMRLKSEAERALMGKLKEPGRAIAALLRSDAPLSKGLRILLADFLDHGAARYGRPVASFSGAGQTTKTSKFEVRMGRLQIGLRFRLRQAELDGDLDRRTFIAEGGAKNEADLDRGTAYARDYDRWLNEEADHVIFSVANSFESQEASDEFLAHEYVDWLVEDTSRDPR